jgi:hypothetical protein
MNFRFLALLLAALALLTASAVFAQSCAPCPENANCQLPECPTEEPALETSHIRLWNRSEQDMENVLVEYPSQIEEYGDIPAGQVTDYRAVDFAYGYAYIRLTVDGKELVLQPIDYVGEVPLEPRYFTYALDIVDGRIAHQLLQVVATVEYQGGLCVYGACSGLVTLYDDGTLVEVYGPDAPVIHTVESELVQALADEIIFADYEAIRSQPFTGTCPTAYDGQELIYTFYNGAEAEVIASCEYEIDESLPLFALINEILAIAEA